MEENSFNNMQKMQLKNVISRSIFHMCIKIFTAACCWYQAYHWTLLLSIPSNPIQFIFMDSSYFYHFGQSNLSSVPGSAFSIAIISLRQNSSTGYYLWSIFVYLVFIELPPRTVARFPSSRSSSPNCLQLYARSSPSHRKLFYLAKASSDPPSEV